MNPRATNGSGAWGDAPPLYAGSRRGPSMLFGSLPATSSGERNNNPLPLCSLQREASVSHWKASDASKTARKKQGRLKSLRYSLIDFSSSSSLHHHHSIFSIASDSYHRAEESLDAGESVFLKAPSKVIHCTTTLLRKIEVQRRWQQRRRKEKGDPLAWRDGGQYGMLIGKHYLEDTSMAVDEQDIVDSEISLLSELAFPGASVWTTVFQLK
ncbi:hypothetical protein NC653_030067 [Populus alba x Populus x berolinensis]|uniref:Uncharacterized protein n=1 Tax=Populus alba x Populus x berolinensis TaxID=444605 RepID=A0AAD6LV99_9ROSI|nr:hypothetical protein NC653_030067 [Populus alba x Populus x berolinensis]